MKFDVTVFADDLNAAGLLAHAVEEYGFDGLWVAEAAHNPFLPLAHAALATRRILHRNCYRGRLSSRSNLDGTERLGPGGAVTRALHSWSGYSNQATHHQAI